jgi:hypothetical protein
MDNTSSAGARGLARTLRNADGDGLPTLLLFVMLALMPVMAAVVALAVSNTVIVHGIAWVLVLVCTAVVAYVVNTMLDDVAG